MRKTLWERSEKFVVRNLLRERHCEKVFMRKTLSERRCVIGVMKKTLWECHFETL